MKKWTKKFDVTIPPKLPVKIANPNLLHHDYDLREEFYETYLRPQGHALKKHGKWGFSDEYMHTLKYDPNQLKALFNLMIL